MNARSRPLILINPVAARARRLWPSIKERLAQAGILFDWHETTHKGEAEIRTRHALRAKEHEIIVVVGGDGTLSEAASGFFESCQSSLPAPSIINSAARLAILPAGTGDDFARGLTGQRASLESWLEKFITYCREDDKGTTRVVDLIYASVDGGARRFICLNAATLGIGAEVASRVATHGRMMRLGGGEARFALAALRALAAWRVRPVRLCINDTETFWCITNLLAVTNGRFAGGGMMFAPAARIDDGLLEVIMTDGISRPTLLRELTRIHRGGHLANPRVSLKQGTHVKITASSSTEQLLVEADGNVRGYTPAEFRIMPSALRVVA